MVVVWIISPGVSSGSTLVLRFVPSGFGCLMKLELGDSSFLPPCVILLPSSSFLPSVVRVLSLHHPRMFDECGHFAYSLHRSQEFS